MARARGTQRVERKQREPERVTQRPKVDSEYWMEGLPARGEGHRGLWCLGRHGPVHAPRGAAPILDRER